MQTYFREFPMDYSLAECKEMLNDIGSISQDMLDDTEWLARKLVSTSRGAIFTLFFTTTQF